MFRSTSVIAIVILAFALATAADEKKESKKPAEQKKEETSTEASAKSKSENESPLVKAARESKARRDGGEKSRITITNEDVEKSGGKLIQSTNKPLDPLPSSKPTSDEMRQVAAENAKAARREELQAQILKHQTTVRDLEKELRRIEETYYNEDDPDYREDVLAQNFEETRDQLEAARKDLAAARKALASVGGS